MRLIVSPVALKNLAAMPQRDRDALIAKSETLAADPFASHGWARPLQGADRTRIRQGDWRAIFRINRSTATVTMERVAHRREVYR
jgi:mRNA-degrading endonuclease RelE of RelBE toxin-antitoxin system